MKYVRKFGFKFMVRYMEVTDYGERYIQVGIYQFPNSQATKAKVSTSIYLCSATPNLTECECC